MSRIGPLFEQLRASGTTALIPFLTAGDPQPGLTVALMHRLAGAGANLIELGIPFSDPMAEGPVIQRACERALAHGTGLHDVLAMVAEFRRADPATPVVLMGYANPLEVTGYTRFSKAAAAAGVDGVITVDLPPEEADEYRAALQAHGVDPVFLLSPTSSDARIDRICAASRGFVYYVSLRGVTGAANLDLVEVQQRLAHIRTRCTLPLGVGFGIGDADTAARVAPLADAVIVGSALVRRIEALVDAPQKIGDELADFTAQLRRALDRTHHTKVASA